LELPNGYKQGAIEDKLSQKDKGLTVINFAKEIVTINMTIILSVGCKLRFVPAKALY
jgi:hypothetical protein